MPVRFVKAAAPSDDPILSVAAKMEGKLKAAFLRAVKTLRAQISADELADAIKSGDVDKAMAMLAIDQRFVDALKGAGQEASIQSFKDAIRETFEAGAQAAATALPTHIGVRLAFDLINPESAKFLETYSFNLIQQVSANTKEAVRDVVSQAFKTGGHPYEQARQIKQFIGLTAHQTKAVSNYRAALSSTSTLGRALDRSLRDGRYDSTIETARRNNVGLSAGQIDKMTARYQERFIQYRAQTIARTESIRASNQGQRALWGQAVTQGLLDEGTQRVWITSGDDRTCEICGDLDGTTVGLDEEFDDGIMEPPDPHSDCRCTTALVFS